jgi:hypothetical protein
VSLSLINKRAYTASFAPKKIERSHIDNEGRRMSTNGCSCWFILLSAKNAHVLELLLVSIAVSKKVLNLIEVFDEPEEDDHFDGFNENLMLPSCYLLVCLKLLPNVRAAIMPQRSCVPVIKKCLRHQLPQMKDCGWCTCKETGTDAKPALCHQGERRRRYYKLRET